MAMAATDASTLRAIPNPVDGRGRTLDKSAAGILAKPFERLRYDLLQEKEKRRGLMQDAIPAYLESVTRHIAAQIDYEGDEKLRDDEITRLMWESSKASRLLEGEMPHEGNSPNPNGPYRRLLWAVVNELAELHCAPEAYQAHCESLANSRAMRQQLEQFRLRVGEGLFTMRPGTTVQYGPPGSWFFQANSPDKTQSVINLDLRGSLYLGDYVDAVFQHELQHHEQSLHYPKAVEDARKRVIDARKDIGYLDGRKTAIGTEAIPTAKRAAVAEYLEAAYMFSLRQQLWNAIEDNMCNHGLADLSNPELKFPAYPYRLDYGINLTKTVLTGVGDHVTKKPSAAKWVSQQSLLSMHQKLQAVGHALDMGVFIHNDLATNDVAGWESIGVNPQLMQHRNHPEWDQAATYRDVMHRLIEIGQTQPIPSQRSRRDYPALSQAKCSERNHKIDALFNDYLEADLARAAKEFRNQSLDEQLAMLEAQILAARESERSMGAGGGDGLPILVDEGGGSLALPDMAQADNANPGHDVPAVPPEPVGASREWDALERDAMNARDPDAGTTNRPKHKAAKPSAPFKAGKMIGGKGHSAIGKLVLTDGRTLQELRDDPLYEQAVEEIAEQLRAISRRCPSVATAREDIGTLWQPPHGDLDSLDEDKIFDTANHIAAGTAKRSDFDLYRDDCIATIESPGDLNLEIDASGSMGSGAGSRLDAAMKGAALLYDAGRRADFSVYIKLWGNEHPTVIATPAMPVEEADGYLDRAYRAAVLHEHIEGLHCGTQIIGTLGDTFARLHLDDNGRAPTSLRGPVHSMILSDGGIYGEEVKLLRFDTTLQHLPAMTIDCALTDGTGSELHQILQRDTDYMPSHQQPICLPLDKAEDVFPAMLDWVMQRHEQFVSMIEANPRWTLTQQHLQEQAGEALNEFCHQHGCNEQKILHHAQTQQGLPTGKPSKLVHSPRLQQINSPTMTRA